MRIIAGVLKRPGTSTSPIIKHLATILSLSMVVTNSTRMIIITFMHSVNTIFHLLFRLLMQEPTLIKTTLAVSPSMHVNRGLHVQPMTTKENTSLRYSSVVTVHLNFHPTAAGVTSPDFC